jgi:hypothetical protein
MNTLNNHVIDLLGGELKIVVDDALVTAEQLDPEQMQPLYDALVEIRGACAIAGLEGLRRLTDEMAVSIETAMANEIDKDALADLLADSLSKASKFIDLIISAKAENTCVLLPEITAFRRLRGQPPLYEYHCLNEVTWPLFDKEISVNPLAGEQKEDIKRLLHLFQFGMLDIIKNNNQKKAFAILYRVAQRLEKIAQLPMEKDYWWVLALVLRSLAENRLDLQVERIRLIAAVEKQLRLLSAENPGEGRNPYPEGLWRAFVSLVALNESRDQAERQRRMESGIPELDFTEEDITVIRKSILPDSSDDGREVFESVNELLISTRSLLDSTQQEDGDSDIGINAELMEGFGSLAELWEKAGFSGLSSRFKQHSDRLQSFRPDEELPAELLLDFIDVVLQAEYALVEFNHVPPTKKLAEQWESRPLTEILQASLLKTSQIAVLDELEMHFDGIKEMLGDASSDYAGEEIIPELESAFQLICSNAKMLGMARLFELTTRCLNYTANRLFKGADDQAVSNYWEVFADSVACLEYYIDGCKTNEQADESSLNIADECLVSLGV